MSVMINMSKLDHTFIEIAITLSKLSHCVSRKVGCVLVKDNRIISTGYNGTPSNFPNCDEVYSDIDSTHHDWSHANEIHAELNAILWAAKNGVNTENTKIYTTLEPCQQCLKNLIQAGVIEVIYLEEYPKAERDVQFLENVLKYGNFRLTRMSPVV